MEKGGCIEMGICKDLLVNKLIGGSGGGGNSGGSMLVVNVGFSDTGLVADKTFEEIYSAYNAGTFVLCSALAGIILFPHIVSDSYISFDVFTISNTELMYMEVLINSDNTIEPIQKYFTLTEATE
jgi:hypothetical protein